MNFWQEIGRWWRDRQRRRARRGPDREADARRAGRAVAPPIFDQLESNERGNVFFGTVALFGHEIDCTFEVTRKNELASLHGCVQDLLDHGARLDGDARASIAAAQRGEPAFTALAAPDSFARDLRLIHVRADDRGTVEFTYRGEACGGTRVIATSHDFDDQSEREWELAVRGDGFRRGVMPLVLDGSGYAIRSAKLGVHVGTERWSEHERRWLYGLEQSAVGYSLEIVVDDASGEDGAPAPRAQVIPVTRAHGGRPPRLAELPGIVADDRGDWEAFYGNDAPNLEDNRLTFGAWNNGGIALRWEARYGWRRKLPFLFDGEAQFVHIGISVKNEADADAFMNALFGAEYVASLVKEFGEWQEYGRPMPSDRRRWLPVRYRPIRGT